MLISSSLPASDMAENLPPTNIQEPVEMLDAKPPPIGAEEVAKARLEAAPGAENLDKSESGDDLSAPDAADKEPSTAALLPQPEELEDAAASQGQDAAPMVKEEIKAPLTTVPVAVNLGDDFLAPKAVASVTKPEKEIPSSSAIPDASAPTTMDLGVSRETPSPQTQPPAQPPSQPPAVQPNPQLQMSLPPLTSTKTEMPPPSQAPSQVHQALQAPAHTSHAVSGPVVQSPQQQGLRLGLSSNQVMSPYQSSMPPPGIHMSPALQAQQMPQHQQQHVSHYQQQPQHYQQQQPNVMQPQHQSPMMHHQPHMVHQTPPMPPQVQPMQPSPMLSAHSQHVPQQQMMHSPQVMMTHPGASTPTQQLMPQQSHMMQGYQQQHGTPYMVGMPPANSPPRTMLIQQPAGMVSPGFGPGDFGSWAPFTTAQWQELEQQAMVFKYLVAGAPVPQELVDSMRASLAQAMAHGRIVSFGQSLWGAQVDPEPYRCRRTDGKKWRCSREVVPDQKYCERHMHRGRNRARKTSDKSTPGTSLVSADESADPVHKSASQGGSELLSDDGARLDRSESMAGTLSSGGPPPLALPPSAHAAASDGQAASQQPGVGPHVLQRPQTGHHTQHEGHQAQHPQQQQQQRSLQLFPQSAGGSSQSAGPAGTYQAPHSQQYMQSSQYQQHHMGAPSQTSAPGQYQQTGYGQSTMHPPSHTYNQHPQQQHYPISNQQPNSGYGQQYQSTTYTTQQPMPQQQTAQGGAPYSAQNPTNGPPVQAGHYQMSQNNRGLAPNGQGPQGPTYSNQPQYTSQGYPQQTGYAQPYTQQQGQGTYSSAPSQHGAQNQSYGQPQFQQGSGSYLSAQHPQGPSHMSHQNTGQPLVRSESQYSSQSSYVHAGDAHQQHYYVQQGPGHPGSQTHSMGASTYSGTGQVGSHMQGGQGGYTSGAPSPPASQMSEVQHFQAQQQQPQQPGAAPSSSGLVATSSTGDKVPLLRVPSILQVERSSGSSITYDQPAMALCM